MMSPDERLCTALPVDSPLGQMCYNEPPDSSTGIDPALLNQLLEMPAFLEMLDPHLTSSMLSSFEQGADANSTFANTENMDMNYTQNFGSYTQDFSHYSDLQFNMLVNESQTPQSEAQDSSSNIVQVKTEEELWGRDSQDHVALLHTLPVHFRSIVRHIGEICFLPFGQSQASCFSRVQSLC